MERKRYAGLVESLDLEQLKSLDPVESTEPGPFKFTGFNVYYSLPEAIRPAFLWGLDNMIRYFYLTKVNLARVMGRAEDDARVVDLAYGQIANDFGELFDHSFSDRLANGGEGVDDKIWELRRIFYRMIISQGVKDVRGAVNVIVEKMEFNPLDKEQIVGILKQYRENETVWNAITKMVVASHGGRYPSWWSELLGNLGFV